MKCWLNCSHARMADFKTNSHWILHSSTKELSQTWPRTQWFVSFKFERKPYCRLGLIRSLLKILFCFYPQANSILLPSGQNACQWRKNLFPETMLPSAISNSSKLRVSISFLIDISPLMLLSTSVCTTHLGFFFVNISAKLLTLFGHLLLFRLSGSKQVSKSSCVLFSSVLACNLHWIYKALQTSDTFNGLSAIALS